MDAIVDKTQENQNDTASARQLGGIPLITLFKFILPLAIIGGGVAGYAMLKASKPAPRKPQVVEKVWPADAVTAVASAVTPKLSLYGKTVSSRQVDIRALVSGKIIEVGDGLKEGALVKKGEMLLKIDAFDYQGALTEATANLNEAIAKRDELSASIKLEESNLSHALDQLELAKKDYNRVAELSKKGTVTKKLADDRNVIVSQREQAAAASRVNIELQKARMAQQVAIADRLQWKVTQAKRRLEETTLTAPFNAYVSAVNAEVGKTVSANDSIARLIDREEIDVRFVLSDAQYGRILAHENTLIGRDVAVSWKVGETPVTYTANVVRIGAEISSQSGGVEVYAKVDNPTEPTPLRAGAFVEVTINDRQYEDVYQMPQTALYNGSTIYLIENERLKPVTIEVVGTSGSDILVAGDIPSGSRILTTRLTLAGEGVKVDVREPKTPDAKNAPLDKTANAAEKAAKGL